MQSGAVAIFLFIACLLAVAIALVAVGRILNPRRPGRVKRMPYESGMDPVHDTRRRFDVRFHLLAIAFLLFDVELLFLYPWAVAVHATAPAAAVSSEPRPATASDAALSVRPPAASSAPRPIFVGGMVFVAILALGFAYDWGKGVFRWR